VLQANDSSFPLFLLKVLVMGDLLSWLLHEDRKDLYEFLVALALDLLVFALLALDRATAYVASGLALGSFLQMGWSAFAALAVHGAIADAALGSTVLSYVAGVLSCVVAFFAVASVFHGAIYRLVHFPLGLLSFLVFSVWPQSGGALYGWFFRLFGEAAAIIERVPST